jgi:signal transduction histidine kinase
MASIDWTSPHRVHYCSERARLAERPARTVLYEFLESTRAQIIARTKAKVSARAVPRATEAELTQGISLFFDQLIHTLTASTLNSTPPSDEMGASATKHGNEMLRMGFTVGQVVHVYGDLCRAVTELAFKLDAQITLDEFHTLNRCLDDAVAQAVTEYRRLREQSLTDQETERMGHLAHELRNRLNTAMLSFGIIKGGTVTIGGGIGVLLDRSLKAMSDLIDRSLAEIGLEATVQRRETILLAEFIEEMEIAAIIEAKARGHQLTVEPVEYGVVIDADRQLLGAAVSNLLQNAFKFTHDPGHVWLRTHATADLVLIDIEDECGGLPPGRADALFRPFHQRSTDRSGLGLGLSISRKAVQLNSGEIRVRNLPGRGCIFTVELPRKSGGSLASVGHGLVSARQSS